MSSFTFVTQASFWRLTTKVLHPGTQSDDDVDLTESPFIPPVEYQVHQQPVITCAPGDCQPPGPSALANSPLPLPPISLALSLL